MLGPEHAWHTRDPRSSSTQSLAPSYNENEDRRTLLVVYIHGFMGDNTSFRSFPAHVHYFLREQLGESHVVHSKVYPRYKTYKAIDVARDKFSAWLEPHEGEKTDVVLIGHSMGGLLAADVALIPSPNPVYGSPFKHRILGTISLDAPLLGLHPGIITSGIASLFRKAPDPPGREQALAEDLASQNASGSLSLQQTPSLYSDAGPSSGTMSPVPLSTLSSNISVDSQPDPNFNPTFYNDVPFIDRGFWKNVAHFAKKHYSDGLVSSTYQHLLSHLEFGSCLADYPSLKNRYNRIRRLEDVDELNNTQGSRKEPRVRFVNYYTVSTGIPKKPPTPKRADTHLRPVAPDSQQDGAGASGASTPRISIEDYSDNEEPQTLHVLDPVPVSDDEDADHHRKHDAPNKTSQNGEPRIPEPSNGGGSSNPEARTEVQTASSTAAGEGDPTNLSSTQADPSQDGSLAIDHDLPAIPDPPEPPQAPDFTKYSDKEARKQAEKEFKRTQKGYEQAVKNREKAIKERQKLVEKRQKKAQKEAEKRQKEEAKRLAKEQAQGKQKNTGPPEDEEVNSATDPSRPSEAQVVTPAQAQMLERQLTDLAFREREATSPPPNQDGQDDGQATDRGEPTLGAAAGQKKLRKFCMLPQKVGGAKDKTWVEVYMKDVDEVGAHCGLFFSGPHYEILIGDVGSRIVEWVREDASKRAILAMD